jgi:hypothetical protein
MSYKRFNNFKKTSGSNSDMVPPTGKDKNSELAPKLEGTSAEEMKRWMDEQVLPLLKRLGAQTLLDKPGNPGRKGPEVGDYNLLNGQAEV